MSTAAIFQIGSLGDSLVSVPSMHSLRALLPDVSEYLLITRTDGQQKVSPAQVFDMAWPSGEHTSYLGSGPVLQKAFSVGRLIAKLRWARPRYAVYLMPSDRTPRQVERDRAFFRAAGVGSLIGFRALSQDELTAGGETGVQRMEAFLRFKRLWGGEAEARFAEFVQNPLIKPTAAALAQVRDYLRQERRYPDRPLVALAPRANWQSKDLPGAIVAELAASLERELMVEVLFLGAAKDREPVEQIRSPSRTGINACGRFTLQQSAAAVACCSLLVGADSGPAHLAAALGVPVVIAFSRIGRELVRWFPTGADQTVLYRDVACAGCGEMSCPVPGHPCMTGISPSDLLSVVAAKLRLPRPLDAACTGTLLQRFDVPSLALKLSGRIHRSSVA